MPSADFTNALKEILTETFNNLPSIYKNIDEAIVAEMKYSIEHNVDDDLA